MCIRDRYNEAHGITPRTVRSAIRDLMEVSRVPDRDAGKALDDAERQMAIDRLEERMLEAANNLDFEKAAQLRDQMLQLRGEKPMASGEQSRQTRRKRR